MFAYELPIPTIRLGDPVVRRAPGQWGFLDLIMIPLPHPLPRRNWHFGGHPDGRLTLLGQC